jgi:hypothetical protein
VGLRKPFCSLLRTEDNIAREHFNHQEQDNGDFDCAPSILPLAFGSAIFSNHWLLVQFIRELDGNGRRLIEKE